VRLLVLSDATDASKALVPALEFLDHEVAAAPLEPELAGQDADVVLIDATRNLSAASHACRELSNGDRCPPLLVVVAEAALAALKRSWGFDDWMLPTAQPAEVETRLRLAADRPEATEHSRGVELGELLIDEDTYVVRLRGRPLDLTFREFELLKYLAHHPNRVFTRSQLLQAVWGYDYYGGTRTVDVHIRRLRAKLGAEHAALISTVRGVGYKLDPAGPRAEDAAPTHRP